MNNPSKQDLINLMMHTYKSDWETIKSYCDKHSLSLTPLVNGMKVVVASNINISYYPTTFRWVVQQGNNVISKGMGLDNYISQIETTRLSTMPTQEQGNLVINIPKGVNSITLNIGN